jgi:predicted metal-dependent HD superfamily phosphohydrolase
MPANPPRLLSEEYSRLQFAEWHDSPGEVLRALNPEQYCRLQLAWWDLQWPFGRRDEVVQGILEGLLAQYAKADRFYHNWYHLEAVLTTIDQLRGQAQDLDAVRLAAWFHDVIYDSRARDNEEQSAAYARESLRALWVYDRLFDVVPALILCTKMHQAHDADGAVLLDADLAILGAAEPEYAAYAAAIRREYAWVPEEQYRAGRRQVLENFLGREHIYFTPPMRQAREEAARRNLRQEIASLT